MDCDEYDGPINLIWESDYPPDAPAAVTADIRRALWGLEKPGDLVFHIVDLTPHGQRGPGVLVTGADDGFICEYVVPGGTAPPRPPDAP